MAHILKAAALGGVIATIVWLVTIWQWQNAGRDVAPSEIVGQLVVLPLLLTLAWLGALWAVQRLREQAARPLGEAGAATAESLVSADGAPPNAAGTALPDASAWVLAEAVTLSVGLDAASAWSSLQRGATRPGLDAHLQDLDGMAVFTARVPDIDVDEWLWVPGEQARAELAELPPATLRALALLEGPLHDMVETVLTLIPDDADRSTASAFEAPAGADHQPEEPRGKAHLAGVATPRSSAGRQAHAARMPRLTVRLLWPAHWPPSEREVATHWVRHQCGRLLERLDATQAPALSWHTEVLEHPEALWAELDQHLVRWALEPRPEMLLILAADSALDEARIEHMQAMGQLFTSAHQTGRMPGEGAAALLLANAPGPDLSAQANSPLRLWRPVRCRRDHSADAAGRVASTDLSAALAQVLRRSVPPHADLLVISDADHRATRTCELFEALQAVAPDLDPMLQVTRIGEACGDLGLARALVPTALACAALRQSDRPQGGAVATHVQSSHERVVVAVTPMPTRLEAP